MLNCFVTESIDSAIPIRVIASNQYQDWLSRQTEVTKQWLHATQFRPEPNAMRLIPGEHGKMAFVLSCTNDLHSLWSVGQLALQLPEGVYHFDQVDSHLESYAIAFGLGAYQFTKYKKATRVPAKLVLPQSMAAKVESIVSSIYMVRDLVNTPAENMGPAEFAAFANTLANQLKAKKQKK